MGCGFEPRVLRSRDHPSTMGNRCGFARGDGRFPSGQAPWFDPDDSSVCSNLVTAPRAFRSRGPFDPTGLSMSGRPATGQQRGGRSHTLRPASIGFQRLNGSCGTIDRFCCPGRTPLRLPAHRDAASFNRPRPALPIRHRFPQFTFGDRTAPHPLSRRQNRLAAKGGRKRLETLPDEPFT